VSEDSGRHGAVEDEGGRRGRGLAGLFSRAERGAGKLRQAALGPRRSPALQHALAARERGNLEAAWWLLREALDDPEGDALEAASSLWDVARELGRAAEAARAAAVLVERHGSAGETELAAQYFAELVTEAPEAGVSPAAILRILPALLERAEAERERAAGGEDGSAGDGALEDGKEAARELVRTALRRAVESDPDALTPGLAVRIFEAAREVDTDVARRAAEAALRSPDLHEARRERLRAFAEGREPVPPAPPEPPRPQRSRPVGPPADAPASAAPETTPAATPAARTAPAAAGAAQLPSLRLAASEPDALSEAEVAAAASRLPRSSPAAAAPAHEEGPSGAEEPPVAADGAAPAARAGAARVLAARLEAVTEQGVRLLFPGDRRSAVGFEQVEAVAVAEVEGVAPWAVPVVDLVLNWSRRRQEPLRVVRLRGDELEADAVAGGEHTGGPLRALLARVLESSRAVPLPDPESALGLQLARFETPEAYEASVLRRGA